MEERFPPAKRGTKVNATEVPNTDESLSFGVTSTTATLPQTEFLFSPEIN
jgi:hypothetical protein